MMFPALFYLFFLGGVFFRYKVIAPCPVTPDWNFGDGLK